MQNIFSFNLSEQNNCRVFLFFSLLLLLAYSNSFHASWQFDDISNIIDNPKQHLTQLSFNNIIDAATANAGDLKSKKLNRPIARISLGLNWFWGQNNVTGYHIVNFFIHLCSSWLLFLIIKLLLQTPRLQKEYTSEHITFIAITTTLFWALNPVQIQAVTYIVQRMTSLAAFFSLLALLCYIKARLHSSRNIRFFLFVGAFTSYIFAFLSKENTCALPLVLPFLEIFFFHHTLTPKLLRNIFIALGFTFFLCILVTLILSPKILDVLPALYSYRHYTLWERILTEQRIIIFYLSLLIFPHPARLSIEHDINISTSLISPPATLLAICFNLLFFFFALKIYRRQPLFSFAVIFFYINHLVESTILPLELIFEHRNYLPSLFLFLPLAQVFASILIKNRKQLFVTVSISILLTTIFTALAYATFTRNKDWATPQSLWLDAAVKAPLSARPLLSLAHEIMKHENLTETQLRKAIKLQEIAGSLQQSNFQINGNILKDIALLSVRQGNIDKGLYYYDRVLQIEPNNTMLRYETSKIFLSKGDFNRAREEISTALQGIPLQPEYLRLLALIDLWDNSPDSALNALQLAIKAETNRPDVYVYLGKCFSMLGHYQRARFFFQRAEDYGGANNVLSLCRIENALLDNNQQEAQAELKNALKKYPIAYLTQPLKPPPANKRYHTIPLDNKLLNAFIVSELTTSAELIQNEDFFLE